jgi:hypothetical protein
VHGLLEEDGDGVAPGGEREAAEIDAIDLDRALIRIVEAAEQLEEGALPGSVGAYDGGDAAGGDFQIEAVERGAFQARGNGRRRCGNGWSERARGERRGLQLLPLRSIDA